MNNDRVDRKEQKELSRAFLETLSSSAAFMEKIHDMVNRKAINPKTELKFLVRVEELEKLILPDDSPSLKNRTSLQMLSGDKTNS